LLPKALAAIHPRWHTPHLAILAGGAVGIAAIYSDAFVTIAGQPLTASIVTMSALGAIVTYWRLRLGASVQPDAMLRRADEGS